MSEAARDPRLTRRRFLVLASLVVTGAGLLQACGQQAPAAKPAESKPAEAAKPAGGATPAAGAPKRGGTVTALVQNDWTSLDPPFEIGAGAGFNMLYDGWVVLEKDAAKNAWEFKPALLASWDLKPD